MFDSVCNHGLTTDKIEHIIRVINLVKAVQR